MTPFNSVLVFFLVVLLAKRRASLLASAAASADEVVYLTSDYGQLVSSSTLRWRPFQDGDAAAGESALREGKSLLCRGYHQDQLSPGQTDDEGKCRVGFHERTYGLDRFQVMVDPTSTSRLEWKRWDIFTKIPAGAVAFTGEDGLVARKKEKSPANETASYRFGDLNPRRGLSGDIAVYRDGDGQGVDYATKGEVLVEVQPVRYELRDVTFHTRRAREKRERVHLGNRVLANELTSLDYERGWGEGGSNEWGAVRAVMAYNASYSYYWGRLPGLVKTLKASAPTFRDGKRTAFRWGLPLEFSLHRILELSARLLKGTAVQASASAARVTTEVPYSATLAAVFADGAVKTRPIEATYVETLLSDVETRYGRAYFARNGSFAPTTTTTTTPRPYYHGGREARFEAPRTMNPLWPGGTTEPTAPPDAPPSNLRPRRTTTPLPTSPNPLNRFYQQFDEGGADGPSEGKGFQADQAKNNKRSPQTESLVNSAASLIHRNSVLGLCFVMCLSRRLLDTFVSPSHRLVAV